MCYNDFHRSTGDPGAKERLEANAYRTIAMVLKQASAPDYSPNPDNAARYAVSFILEPSIPATVEYMAGLRPQGQPMGQLRHAASKHQSAFDFPRDYHKLPTVSFVSPNMCQGMHDCSIRSGDCWMKKHFDRYAQWAPRQNSWLIVTFDENAGGRVKPIFTIIVGAEVRPGVYAERLNHYRLLRTIEEAYGLPPLGRTKATRPLSTIWAS